MANADENREIADIITTNDVRPLLDSFCRATGVAAAILDLHGNIIISSRWHPICTDFHRVHPETCRRCTESDTVLANMILDGKRCALYTCRNGLTDAAAPIMVEGRHIANLFVGQFLMQPPDREYFRTQALDCGFEEQLYLQMLDDVPIVPAERVEPILEFLTGFAQLLSSMASTEKRLAEHAASLAARDEELDRLSGFVRASDEQLRAAMLQLEANNQQLEANTRELRESNEFLENIFDTTADGIMVTDENGFIVRINKAVEGITGYQEYELIGEHVRALVPEDEANGPIGATIKKSLENGSVRNLEVSCRRKDGSVRFLELNITFIQGTTGIIDGSVVAVRDVTERRQTEQERLVLSSAIEQAAELIVIIGVDGKVSYVNPVMESFIGYDRPAVLGINLFQQDSPVYGKGFYQKIRDVITSGNTWKGEITAQRRDGMLCNLRSTVTAIRDHCGSVIGYLAISRDVTAETRMEKQIRQAQKMEAIGTLAGGIAHDFNNILGAIMGYTEMSLVSLLTETPVYANLREVMAAAQRAKNLIQQIMTFSRQSEQEVKPVRIKPIVQETINFLKASLPSTIEIRQSFETETDIVLADATQLHQVIMNLCTNARQAMMPHGGVLAVGLQQVTLDTADIMDRPDMSPGPYLMLSVRDSGCGMEPAVLEKIFDPFFSTKQPGEGTGLGLSVVHGILQGCHGAIKVSSTPGTGTEVLVYLPLSDRDTSAPEAADIRPLIGGPEHILVVDDEEPLTDIMKQMLKSLGYRVTARTSSIEALEAFRANPDAFHLVITDQTMPNMTGAELAGKLRAQRHDIPIIICTGFSETINDRQAEAMGVGGFLMKPVLRAELAQTVRDVLDREKMIGHGDATCN
jgi:PAS domain S-box-containing protein